MLQNVKVIKNRVDDYCNHILKM